MTIYFIFFQFFKDVKRKKTKRCWYNCKIIINKIKRIDKSFIPFFYYFIIKKFRIQNLHFVHSLII